MNFENGGTFYTVGEMTTYSQGFNENEPAFKHEFRMDDVTFGYYPIGLTPFEVLGGIGGVFELLIMLLGLIMFPLAEHNFIYSAAKRLYFARTNSETLIQTTQKQIDNQMEPPFEQTEKEAEELEKHHLFNIRCKRNCYVKIRRLCGICMPGF